MTTDITQIRFNKEEVVSQLKVFKWVVVMDRKRAVELPDCPYISGDVDCKEIILQSQDNEDVEICFFILSDRDAEFFGYRTFVKMWHTPTLTKMAEFTLDGWFF